MQRNQTAENEGQSQTPTPSPDEVEELRARLAEAEETLRAIRSGEVDALVVSGADGERVYTLAGADHPYRVLIEEMNEGAATLTPDGVVLYCNRRFAAMLRVPLERVIGSSIEPWIAPANRMTFLSLLGRGTKAPQRGEIALQTANGVPLPALLSLGPVGTDSANAVGLVATDLTEQKRSEAILAAESLARSILDQATEAVVVCDEHGWIDRASQAAQALCGRDPVGRSFLDAFPLQMSDGKNFPLIRVLGGEHARGLEARLERSERTFDLLISAGPLTDAQQHPLGCIVTLTDVGERRRAEDALRATGERFAAALEASPVSVFTQDRELRYTWIANPAPDYDGTQVRGRTDVEIIEEDEDVRRLVALKRAVLADGRTRREEVRVRRQGAERWYDLHVRAQRDAAGAVTGLLCTATDITERKRMEEDLRRSEAIYRRLADANLIGVAYGDAKGNTTTINDEMLRMMGYTREDYEAGRINWSEVLAPEFRADFARWGEELLREGRITGIERAFQRPDGGRTPYLGAAAQVASDEDFHVRIALDLTDIRAAQEALREGEARYRTLFATSPSGIVIFDPESGRPVEFNTAAHRGLGYTREEFAQLHISDLEAGDTPEETQAHIEKVLREGRDGFETRYRTRDGEIRHALVTARRIELGGKPYVYTNSHDITERVRAEELRLANERFNASLGTSPVLVYTMDRELRYTWVFNPRIFHSAEESLGKTDAELFDDPEGTRAIMAIKRAVLEDGQARRETVRLRHRGVAYAFDMYVRPQRDAAGAVTGLLGTSMEIERRAV